MRDQDQLKLFWEKRNFGSNFEVDLFDDEWIWTQVFLSATPDHWCAVDTLSNLTVEQRKDLAIPKIDGKFSKCTMYQVDYTQELIDDLDDVIATNRSLWPTGPCLNGWEYDSTQYDSTLVTEVTSNPIIHYQ